MGNGEHPALNPELVSLDDLSGMAAPYNPRYITAHELSALEASFDAWGVVEALVVNRRSESQGWPADSTPAIVGGHQRVKAAARKGLKDLPCTWVDLSAIEEKKLNLALNRIRGEWDDPKLADILAEIKAEEGEVGIEVGFLDKEIAELTALEFEVPGGEPAEGFASGQQVSDGCLAFVIFIPPEKEADAVFRTDLTTMCEDKGLAYKVRRIAAP